MAFMNLTLIADMDWTLQRLKKKRLHHLRPCYDSETLLRNSAEKDGVHVFLEPNLWQLDKPLYMHVTTMRPDYLTWPRLFEPTYQLRTNT